jgi:NADH dehydrogenase FAD-containing subunit
MSFSLFSSLSSFSFFLRLVHDLVERMLVEKGIQFHNNCEIIDVMEDNSSSLRYLISSKDNGIRYPYDECFWCTDSMGAVWLKDTGLALDEDNCILVQVRKNIDCGLCVNRTTIFFLLSLLLFFSSSLLLSLSLSLPLTCSLFLFLFLKPTLESINCKGIFAAGDIIHNIKYPRPKAGVFAVRAGLVNILSLHFPVVIITFFVSL